MALGLASALLVAASVAPVQGKPRNGDVVVTGPKFDPVTQLRGPYGDLNLAMWADQRQLRGPRLFRAIRRAKLQMAGHAVAPPVAIAMVIAAR